jgi:hypothetical protein
MTRIEQSNSLTDLAFRIKAEHEAVSIALKDSVRHANDLARVGGRHVPLVCRPPNEDAQNCSKRLL